MENQPWSLQHAKTRFSAGVESARRCESQRLTKRGAPAAVVVAAEEYASLKALDEQQAPSWVDSLLAVPQNDEASNRLEVALRDITP